VGLWYFVIQSIEATKWLQNIILKTNLENPKFLDDVLEKYKEKLLLIHKLWKDKVLSIKNLEKLIILSKEAIAYFVVYYYSAVDDRTPEGTRNKALEMRNKDEFFAKNDTAIRDSLTGIYPKLKGYETAIFFDELKSIQNMNVLKERKESSFIIQGKDKFVGSFDQFSELYKNFSFNNGTVDRIDPIEIKGEIAQKGKVIGKVKILRRGEQIDEVSDGDIIVSPMTTPNFLPAMKKAAAFVTDEGGITCHAGIVARELKKPCIIATKIATQALKDGDMVEVDADKGVVRIINDDKKGDLSDKFLKLVGERKLYPPLNGYSAFLQGSEYSTQKYNKKWYDDKVRFDLFVHMKEGYSQVWLTEDDIKIASEYTLKEYLKDSKFFERRGEYISDSIKKLDEIYDQYTYKKISKTDWSTLFTLVDEIRDIMWDVNAAVIFTIYLDKQMCADILKKENYPISKEELDILWEKAVEPAFESFDKSQLNHFLGLVKDRTDWDDVVEKCQYILSDYHSTKTLAEVEKVLNERYKDYIDKSKAAVRDLEAETEHINKEVQAHEEWLKSLPENERVIAYYLQTVMRIRDRRKNFFAKGMTIIYRIAEKMFAEAGIERELIPFYTVHELLKGTEHLKSSLSNLVDRKKGFQWLVPYIGEVEGLNTNIDSGAEKINKYFKECHSSIGDQSTIKGQSGFRGVVRGKVRIVLNMNSEHGFTEGEILVAGMTRPEYVPLMKKAVGIVTDEGGITCHAAIVSRELKIPCVVGTKIATKILKDGDMVEVDADNGIVKII
jgi:phosphohistidine swiveling domain-containing protein